MGSVKKYLFKCRLPERETHHSRMFVDLAENIHIHHREYRTVFSLDEFFEYADILTKSTQDVRNFLAQNRDYREQKYPTTIMIAGGSERQYQFLTNSPQPNQSKYLDDEFAIELQDEFVTDEVQIHYRDFRIALNRERFRVLAEGFQQALQELNQFEKSHAYIREYHPDHVITDFNEDNPNAQDTRLMGVVKMPIEQIKSPWYSDINKDWQPDKESIEILKKEYITEGRLFPILVSTESDGTHLIIDGHHRTFAARELGLAELDVIISDLTHKQSEVIRTAEASLKELDKETGFKYAWSHFMKTYFAYTLNRHYADSYSRLMRRQSLYYRVARKVKRWIFGKRHIFKKFNEAHNN